MLSSDYLMFGLLDAYMYKYVRGCTDTQSRLLFLYIQVSRSNVPVYYFLMNCRVACPCLSHVCVPCLCFLIINNVTMRSRERPKRIWMEAIKKDMLILHVTSEMILSRAEWMKRFMQSTPNWDKSFVVVVVDDDGDNIHESILHLRHFKFSFLFVPEFIPMWNKQKLDANTSVTTSFV